MKSIFLFIAFIFAGMSFGQNSDDTIAVSTFNGHFLDSLIFKTINQVRLDSNQTKLFFSDSLNAEAEKHAVIMTGEGIVYYSDSRSKAGECNLKSFVKNDEITYQTLAKEIVQKWLDSPGHAKLLLGEFFLYGGCGVSSAEWKSVDEMYVYVCFRISYWP